MPADHSSWQQQKEAELQSPHSGSEKHLWHDNVTNMLWFGLSWASQA